MKPLLLLLAFLLFFRGHTGAAEIWKLDKQLVFTDEWVQAVSLAETTGKIPVEINILTCSGWKQPFSKIVPVAKRGFSFQPTTEGIYLLRLPDQELRFLAMNPPPDWNPAAANAALPRQGQKLSEGKPFTLLCMGDSVTETGDYAEMLAMMLRRSCRNPEVRVIKKAYSGRSVDASVRRWALDSADLHPDLGLIMYGINDQGANVPLPAYVEQYAWLASQLRTKFDADTLFLQPTPKIDLLQEKPENPIAASSLFQTITYGAALEIPAKTLALPVVYTFDALWGPGGTDLKQTAMQMKPLFPPHYKAPFQTMMEKPGPGDGVHPNALGHLQIARAVFDCLQGKTPQKKLKWSATTSWEGSQLKSHLSARNVSSEKIQGTLDIFPFAGKDLSERFAYVLEPGAEKKIDFVWPGITKPLDLEKDPALTAFKFPGPFLQIVNTFDTGSEIYAPGAPWSPSVFFAPQRLIVEGTTARISLQIGDKTKTVDISIPKASQVGRLPLLEKGEVDGKTGSAVAELAYVRFSKALSIEVKTDGDLLEWKDADWSPLGEKVQARGNYGPADNRQTPEECFLHFTFAAGSKGIVMAFLGTGEILKDSATLYFDPRPPQELGTAGPYTWIDLKFVPDGKIAISAGDSSPARDGSFGFWKKTGASVSGEIFVPYGILGTVAWPESGDLGLSLVWRHVPEVGKNTTLMWAENGHPWNPRWFGVVRLNPKGPLPYRVRVE